MENISNKKVFLNDFLLSTAIDIAKIESKGHVFYNDNGELKTTGEQSKEKIENIDALKLIKQKVEKSHKFYFNKRIFDSSKNKITDFFIKKYKEERDPCKEGPKKSKKIKNWEELLKAFALLIDTIYDNHPPSLEESFAGAIEEILKKPEPLSEEDCQFLSNSANLLFVSREARMRMLLRNALAEEMEDLLKANSCIEIVANGQNTKYYNYRTLSIYQADAPGLKNFFKILREFDSSIPESGPYDIRDITEKEFSDDFIRSLLLLSKNQPTETEKAAIERLFVLKKWRMLDDLLIENRESIMAIANPGSSKKNSKEFIELFEKYKDNKILKIIEGGVQLLDIDQRNSVPKWDESLEKYANFFKNKAVQTAHQEFYEFIIEKLSRQQNLTEKQKPTEITEFISWAHFNKKWTEITKRFNNTYEKSTIIEREIDQEQIKISQEQSKIKNKKPQKQKKKKELQIGKTAPQSETLQTQPNSKEEQIEEKKVPTPEKKKPAVLMPNPTNPPEKSPFFVKYDESIKKWFSDPEKRIIEYKDTVGKIVTNKNSTIFSHNAAQALDALRHFGHRYSYSDNNNNNNNNSRPGNALICWVTAPNFKLNYENKEIVFTWGYQPFYAEGDIKEMDCIHRSALVNLPKSVCEYREQMRKKQETGLCLQEETPKELQALLNKRAPDGSYIAKIEGRKITIYDTKWDCTIIVII